MEKSVKTLIATVTILSTILLPFSYVQPVDSMQTASSKDLGIVAQLQRKDTRMLCLDGCSLTGSHAWDAIHPNKGCDHDYMYCVRASISMIISYYGGDLSQDRISFYHFEEQPRRGDGQPEGDLGHGSGIYGGVELWYSNVLSWALEGARITYNYGKPSLEQLKEWIDSDRPIVRREKHNGAHATVIDGYSYRQIHVINPSDGKENYISYDSLDIDRVWVPPTYAVGRSDEETIWMDSDDDGVVDFDEIVRFYTDPYNPDTDGDGIDDKTEIRSYTFLSNGAFDENDVRKPDVDNDGFRAELDTDSDNGGCPDGLEDKNQNGKVDYGETDPLDASDDPIVHYPQAIFTHQPETGCVNETVTFNATQSFSPNGNIVSYEWDFDDENITTVQPVINHTYTEPRNYNVSLKVTDNSGLFNTTAKTITITFTTDLNQDGIVNIVDVSIVSIAFGTKEGDERYDPIADMDDNRQINIVDVSIVALDYGKTV